LLPYRGLLETLVVPSNTIAHHIGSHSAIEYLLEVFTTYQQCTPYFRHVSDFAAWGKLEALNLSASTLFKEDLFVRIVQDQCSDTLLAANYCLELLRLGTGSKLLQEDLILFIRYTNPIVDAFLLVGLNCGALGSILLLARHLRGRMQVSGATQVMPLVITRLLANIYVPVCYFDRAIVWGQMYPCFDASGALLSCPLSQRTRAFSRCEAALGVECCTFLLRGTRKTLSLCFQDCSRSKNLRHLC